jgi:hypothetical protein
MCGLAEVKARQLDGFQLNEVTVGGRDRQSINRFRSCRFLIANIAIIIIQCDRSGPIFRVAFWRCWVAWTRNKSQEAVIESVEQAPNRDRLVMIGRPQAGKSLVLASLIRQSSNSVHSFADYNPLFFPVKRKEDSRNDLGSLQDLSNLLVQGQSFPATYTHLILDYALRLESDAFEPKKRSSLWQIRKPKPERITADVTLTDAAGDERTRAGEFGDIVRNARSIVYCLPITLTPTSLAADQRQVDVIVDLIMNDKIGLERISICLTKYEAVWAPYGSEAFDLACDRDKFVAVARERVPAGLKRVLIELARRGRRSPSSGKAVEVCLTPVSAFGFVKDNGCVNFNPATGRLLVESGENVAVDARSGVKPPFYSDLEAVRYWQPFYVVDPLIYAAFGQKGDLTIDIEELD